MWSLGVVTFILLSGYMPFKGSEEETKPRIYILATLPNGIKLSDMPGLKGLPGIDECPALAKNAKIGYSSFDGLVADLNLGFLKDDLTKMASGLASKYGSKAMQALGTGNIDELMKLKDEALADAKVAFVAAAKNSAGEGEGSEELLLQVGNATEENPFAKNGLILKLNWKEKYLNYA